MLRFRNTIAFGFWHIPGLQVLEKHDMHMHCKYDARQGFSLIELLAVVAVIVVMMTLLAPAMVGFGGTTARKGAVTTLMNTFEQARVAALESGQNVYVGFADADFPIESMRYASFMVFRDATEAEGGPGTYVVLKPWTALPKNISFRRVNGSMVPLSGGTRSFPGLPLPNSKNDTDFPVLVFTSSGAIEGGGSVPPLFLYEGYFDGTKDVATRDANGLFEKISFSRYTGRAQLDVTGT
jgi:prepilin-type N-terminal cleavage/methylation domain-containing protein